MRGRRWIRGLILTPLLMFTCFVIAEVWKNEPLDSPYRTEPPWWALPLSLAAMAFWFWYFSCRVKT